jgi:PAS domain S-box-containing protein
MFGYEAAEAIGRSFSILIPMNRRNELEEIRQKLKRGKRIEHYETVRLGKDGRPVDVSLMHSPIRDGAGKVIGISIIARDITERKQLEAKILETSDAVQRRVGQDLHDGLIQHLRGIAYLSHVLAEDLAQKSLSGAKDASRITQLLNKAILEAHGLAQGLFPISLEADGLMSALKGLASNVKNIYKIFCRLTCPKPVLIDDSSIAINLFRIAQEAVQNAIKHGKATRVVIRLTKMSRGVELIVKDNGRGLPKHFETRQGMGLKIMDHRASMIGAELQMRRAADGGTLLTCSLQTKRDRLSKPKV